MASTCTKAKKSFEHFLCGQYILPDSIDNDLMRKDESHLKTSGIMKKTVSCYMRILYLIDNQMIKRSSIMQKNSFANIFTRIDKTVKRAVNEETIITLKSVDLSANNELTLSRTCLCSVFICAECRL
jgi:hypothetical protein